MASRIAFKRRERKKRIAFIGTIKSKSGQTLNSKLNQKRTDTYFYLGVGPRYFNDKKLVVRELNDDAGSAKVTVLNAQFTLINRHQVAH